MDEKEIFNNARKISDSAVRDQYLSAVCGDDLQALNRIQALLAADDSDTSFLEKPLAGLGATESLNNEKSPIGERIGPYKLLQEIGEGGMGSVFMAEQTEPVVRRVALKIIKAGMDSKQVIARFEAERQALAMMDHPNIARLLDVGTTESGRPYFVMELVKGVPITEYCDDKRLSVKQRLELFTSVCNAVQHAHQKGIIHRDLKPSNILVAEYDDKVVPKIIDFGLAKALHQSLTDMTMFTQLGQVVGTLAYMSPEQSKMNQLDVDTRTDIYSLGVLLYELLTGTTPFDAKRLKSAALDQVLKIIREEEPPKPSTRISDSGNKAAAISEQRQIGPSRLRQILRGELDWVVMRALEKERSRRYSTANGLGADVQRFLNAEPVVARPPSAMYQLSKFARRYKKLVGALLALTIFAVTTIFLGAMWLISSGQLEFVTQEKQRADRIRKKDIPRIQNDMTNNRYVSAFLTWRDVRPLTTEDPVMDSITKELTVNATIDSNPTNAKVYMRDWRTVDKHWTDFGTLPIRDKQLPRGMVRWKFEKKGFATVETIANLEEVRQLNVDLPKLRDGVELMSQINVNPAFEFLIDQYEVSNQQFKEFIDAGGYSNREFWPQHFYLNGQEITFDEAMEKFRDKSGNHGPANWQGGTYPDGEKNHPVRHVSWYEAYAYARFRGKSLPQLEDWRAASDPKNSSYFIPLSNFSNTSVWPVGQSGGIGQNGLFDMAGNVREWCLDGDEQGNRCTRGGSFNRPAYSFSHTIVHAPFERLHDVGFRCAKYEVDVDEPVFKYRPKKIEVAKHLLSEKEFERLKKMFTYRKDLPFEAADVSTLPSDSKLKIRTFRIASAYGVDESFKVHFIEPPDYPIPCQLVIYLPGLSASTLRSFDDAKYLVDLRVAEAIAKSGRIVCWPEYFGTFEREIGRSFRGTDQEAFVRRLKDVKRALDFAFANYHVDKERIGIVGNSAGGQNSVVAAAIDDRFKSMVLIATGVEKYRGPRSGFIYAPFVKIPTAMICGAKDYNFPALTSQQPLHDLIGTNEREKFYKRQEDCYHDIPWDQAARFTIDWFDKSLGPATEGK